MAEKPNPGSKSPPPAAELVRVYDAVWQLVGAVGLGVAVGYALDRHFESKPKGMVVGAGVGIIFGFIAFFRTVLRKT